LHAKLYIFVFLAKDIMDQIIEILNLKEFDWVAGTAILFGILYIILAARENIWCFAAGAVNICISMYILYNIPYYSQVILHIFYLIMSVYGYTMWKKEVPEKIKEWTLKKHFIIIIIGAIISFILGFILTEYVNDSKQPIIDAFTSIFAVIASYMIARKVLENWLYWIVLDILIIHLLFIEEQYIFSIQYIVYTIMAIYGYISWSRKIEMND
tara:strand:+ start:140 stop:775 length:636 start_codon:yes stop_codon:yes gene_type:complete